MKLRFFRSEFVGNDHENKLKPLHLKQWNRSIRATYFRILYVKAVIFIFQWLYNGMARFDFYFLFFLKKVEDSRGLYDV